MPGSAIACDSNYPKRAMGTRSTSRRHDYHRGLLKRTDCPPSHQTFRISFILFLPHRRHPLRRPLSWHDETVTNPQEQKQPLRLPGPTSLSHGVRVPETLMGTYKTPTACGSPSQRTSC